MRSLFLGLGSSNRALAEYLPGEKWAFEENPWRIWYSDGKSPLSVLKPETSLEVLAKIPSLFKAEKFEDLDWASWLPAKIWISPGIDCRRSFYSVLGSFEIRELDFFCQNFKGYIVAITGTDGKSTLTFQIGELLKRALPGKKIFVGGNLGIAMTEGLKNAFDIAVLEVSSYQCERLQNAKIDLGILINLDIDHLDRYGSIDDYHQAKWNLLRFSSDIAYPADTMPKFPVGRSLTRHFNASELDELMKQVGPFLADRLKFTWAVELLKDLPYLPHRLESKMDDRGRMIINDSKATTVHAVAYGYKKMQSKLPKIQLLLGGVHKGDDFGILKGLIRPSDDIWIFGEAREKIKSQLDGVFPKAICSTLSEVLPKVDVHALRGDGIMLSPGCSSFDEFEDFEERGRFFQNFFRV